MSASQVCASRKRGRPKDESKREVAKRLLAVAERLMEEQGYLEATERKIAASAGVSVSMIHYYFGDKDGLLFAVVDQLASQVADTFDLLNERLDQNPENPTRLIVNALVEAYYSKPWLYRFMLSEMTHKNSIVREMFLKRYGARSQIGIQRMVDRLVAAGIYRHDTDSAYVALSMLSTIIGSLAITLQSEASGITLEELRGDRWNRYLSDLFDRQLRFEAR